MNSNYQGLTGEEVINSRNKYGSNALIKKQKVSLISEIIKVLKEPTLLLLLVASSIYFLLGEYIDGIIMLFCVIFTCSIEFIEGYKTDKALEELNKLSDVNVKVIRNGCISYISSDDIVKGDVLILEEGDVVPADAKIIETNGIGVNESALTGEANTVYKSINEDDAYFKNNYCYKGTSIVTGSAYLEVTVVGKNTIYGQIGTSLNNINDSNSPLQKEVGKVVKIYAIVSIILFLMVMFITFLNSDGPFLNRVTDSLISGITIAIATIPEEIPVILTIFLAMGASLLSKHNTLTRNMKSVENLGKITVLCTDKTGTITENKMLVKTAYEIDKEFHKGSYLASYADSADSMEKAICDYALNNTNISKAEPVKEYLFNNNIKMMGRLYKDKKYTLYVKGAYENIIKLCDISNEEKKKIEKIVDKYSLDGLRVITVASAESKSILEDISDYKLKILGVIALENPIRDGIKESIASCYTAGIRTILITGDSGKTASGIAKRIGLYNPELYLTGEEIEKITDKELSEKLDVTNLFVRVYPSHKARIVSLLEEKGEVVAMTGDGINDATALKKADVGISMGLRGTNVAKEASDIILMDDNFNTIVKAISNGRCIYNNIKKAISYVLAIHIPIALIPLVLPLINIENFLMPVHIVLLELLIDPTCSIIFQRVGPDADIMKKKPHKNNENIIDKATLIRCIVQGLLIFLAVFGTYYYYYKFGDKLLGGSVAFTLLITSIMMCANTMKSRTLTITNLLNSFKDKITSLINLAIFTILLILIYSPLNKYAGMQSLGIKEWIIIITLTLLVTTPFDLTKKK